ncbi:hypothetical protein P2W68_12835 [Chryseobacterium arthrosphaerae]|uniref:DUF6602 domain-containing protein n=1 Tax=Chryseobacterium arthrosphaerae TaxID=651561 RepID=UPI0023E10541|nr:DUF6602 domain-containing protein [Chryseobacterium arthrosphaerae]WES95744.1 hypothetical protein P2W68_12835 [Chryseobacterium arthrosphaerae]
MNNYILDKLRADSSHLLLLSTNEEKIQHTGLRGRLRELLIDNILTPWLPPYVVSGTGTIIEAENLTRESTQDDIILFDKTLAPPILGSNNSKEGIFLYNSVLARIEVKSTATKGFLKDFAATSLELSKLKFTVNNNFNANYSGAFNLFFAFKSDADQENNNPNFELKRLVKVMNELNIDPHSGIVSMICIVGKGFWKIGLKEDGKTRTWQKLNSNEAIDQITWFVGCISNSCFIAHMQRQGRNPDNSLESGIGMYLDHPFTDIDINNL